MIALDVLALEHLLAQQRAGELVELRAVLGDQRARRGASPRRRGAAARRRAARACGRRPAPPSAASWSALTDVPIAHSWIIRREIAATSLQVVGRAGGDRSRRRAAPPRGRRAGRPSRPSAPRAFRGSGPPPGSAACSRAPVPRGTIETRCVRVDARQQLGAAARGRPRGRRSTRRSCSLSARRDSMPATTRSSAFSKSACSTPRAQRARGGDRGLVADVGQLGAGQARRSGARSTSKSTSLASGLLRVCTPRIALRPTDVGRRDEDLAVEAAGPQQRRIELLEQVGRGDHDQLAAGGEAVHLDQQLVERLLALGVVVRAARGADGVDLVDEDDRGRVLARLGEQAPDARGAEAGEHLDEAGGRLREELRAGLVGHGLGQQRLAGAGRAVQQDALRDLRAELAEALRVASGTRRPRCSSALASSTPATSSHLIEPSESGLISCGLVFGISFIVRHRKKTIRAMKRIGAQSGRARRGPTRRARLDGLRDRRRRNGCRTRRSRRRHA